MDDLHNIVLTQLLIQACQGTPSCSIRSPSGVHWVTPCRRSCIRPAKSVTQPLLGMHFKLPLLAEQCVTALQYEHLNLSAFFAWYCC